MRATSKGPLGAMLYTIDLILYSKVRYNNFLLYILANVDQICMVVMCLLTMVA